MGRESQILQDTAKLRLPKVQGHQISLKMPLSENGQTKTEVAEKP